jgi:DNA gyrase subunit A
MRVVVELTRGVVPEVVLNNLFKHTPLQTTFGVITLAIVGGRPRVLPLVDLLELFVDFRRDVVRRRTEFELRKAEARAHILEGLRIALDHLDAVIALIRASRNPAEARAGLVREFSLSELQAQAILDMQLQRLTGLERQKILDELAELLQTIERLRAVLASDRLLMQIVVDELRAVQAKYRDPRRTEILGEVGEISTLDLIADEDVAITVTNTGYIKRTSLAEYRSQLRGGKGLRGMTVREEDAVSHLFVASTHSYILIFTKSGKTYWLRVHEVPSVSRDAKGAAIVNLVDLGGDRIASLVGVRDFPELEGQQYVVMATRKGVIKKTDLKAFSNPRAAGIIAMGVEDDDAVIDVQLSEGTNDIFLGTRDGMAIRFSEEDVRPMGRTAYGVKGITLREGDEVVAMDVVRAGGTMLTVTENGYGKRTDIDEYRVQSRGGLGIINIQTSERNGKVAGIAHVAGDDELMLVTEQGKILRTSVAGIRETGRNAQGVRLMHIEFGDGDRVVSVARFAEKSEEVETTPSGDGEQPPPSPAPPAGDLPSE